MAFSQGYNVIKIPETMKKQLKVAEKLKEIALRKQVAKKARQGDLSVST